MKDRRPTGATPRLTGIASIAEERIRQAAADGAFDDLPGAGKPIEGLEEPHDTMWWVRGLCEREGLRVPATTAPRKPPRRRDGLLRLAAERALRRTR
jgi:hypothetical protein